MNNFYIIIKNKFNNLQRHIFLRHLTRFIPVFLVNEYPKSGGTWLGQMISTYLDIPFPRNSRPAYQTSMFHGHYLPRKSMNYLNKLFFLIRDGRDVVISLYFHMLFENEKNKLSPNAVSYYRNLVKFKDYSDVGSNLTHFIDFIYNFKHPKARKFEDEGNWTSFNKLWLNQSFISKDKIAIVKYEDLLKNTYKEMYSILSTLNLSNIQEEKLKTIVEMYKFENQAKRKRGIENKNSFLRKGISGDWRNYFNKESAEKFDIFAGDMLNQLGYEKSKDWIYNLNAFTS